MPGEVCEPAASHSYRFGESQDSPRSGLDVPGQLAADAWSGRDLSELLELTSARIDANLRQTQASLARIEAKLGSLSS
jgi:hypothetical protein